MCICGKMSPYNGKKHKRWHLHQSKHDSKLFHLVFDVTLPAIVTGWREIYLSVFFLILQLEFYNRQKDSSDYGLGTVLQQNIQMEFALSCSHRDCFPAPSATALQS